MCTIRVWAFKMRERYWQKTQSRKREKYVIIRKICFTVTKCKCYSLGCCKVMLYCKFIHWESQGYCNKLRNGKRQPTKTHVSWAWQSTNWDNFDTSPHENSVRSTLDLFFPNVHKEFWVLLYLSIRDEVYYPTLCKSKHLNEWELENSWASRLTDCPWLLCTM